jgi:hypothetical protein
MDYDEGTDHFVVNVVVVSYLQLCSIIIIIFIIIIIIIISRCYMTCILIIWWRF